MRTGIIVVDPFAAEMSASVSQMGGALMGGVLILRVSVRERQCLPLVMPSTRRVKEVTRKDGVLAARFMDTYQRGLQTLAKIRTGNRQTVTVVHQHIAVAGGQIAVAGAVHPGEARGQDAIHPTTSCTDIGQSQCSPSSPALWGQAEEGPPAVPSPGHAQRAMPNAWGTIARSAEGGA
jgi:hypothetical protein